MEIEQELEFQVVRAFGQRDGVVEIVGQIRWGIEEAQANPIVTMVLENLQRGFGVGAVFENSSALLRLREE